MMPGERMMLRGYALEQFHHKVLVTFPDGSQRTVLNAHLSSETAEKIILAAIRPYSRQEG
jgi:hypothetical protein